MGKKYTIYNTLASWYLGYVDLWPCTLPAMAEPPLEGRADETQKGILPTIVTRLDHREFRQ